MITDRQGHILKLALDVYLHDNDAITSGRLFDRGGFELSSATLRNELARLDELGYLYQPYTSGGRYPTDRALQWFVEEFVVDTLQPDHFSDSLEHEFVSVDPNQHFFYNFAQFAANTCDSFCNVHVDEVSYQAGLDDLFSHLDTDSPETIRAIVRDIERLNERLEEFKSKRNNEEYLEVFIGEKSPVTDSKDLAVLLLTMHNADFDGVTVLIGSKRMPYKRNMSFLEASKQFLEKM
ncbi:MAG: hypothetical protein HZA35_03775 [Parcubacteria group bacterium]|nr:hypothetical protein [Parcubacteria group bacterium]